MMGAFSLQYTTFPKESRLLSARFKDLRRYEIDGKLLFDDLDASLIEDVALSGH